MPSSVEDGVVYLALQLRNAGSGVAHLLGYRLEAQSARAVADDPLGPARHRRGDSAPEPAEFSEQQRDLYVAAGELGFWQAALRDPAVDQYTAMVEAIATLGRVTIDLLYGDLEGGQATITRFRAPAERAEQVEVRRHAPLARGRRD